MSQQLEKLQKLLAELFQLDQADLDFGIYRIMNARREEITRFLEKDLLPQVKQVLALYEKESRTQIAQELQKAKEQAKALGFEEPAQAPVVMELQERYNKAFDPEAAENEIYSHLYNFFRRYYNEGDFISQRRYKEGVYAIPYEGEEVKLYWANHDQYYIKTSEYLRNYAFKLPSGRRVHFKLIDADTEKDNNRALNGNERRFVYKGLITDNAENNGDIVFQFEFRAVEDKKKQAELNDQAIQRMRTDISILPINLQAELLRPAPTEKNPNRTLLEKHLNDFTARNTFDYFIHKDLGGFLRRELDFYIKNEVMFLDDIENETAPRVEQYLAKIKAIRRIAHKIIDFLAQIENYQKKLWLKKKFVVETHYCITIDRILKIDDADTRNYLLHQIASNDAQREEWVRLFAIDEIKGDLLTPGYSIPLTPEFLRAHPTLVVDTRHFDEAFKVRLLAAISDIDDETDGLLIHSENFQALNLLQERYREQVKCIYIDPPYNTGSDEFIYRDDYQHSSWLSMLRDRLALSREWMREEGVIFVSVDDNEQYRLEYIGENVFGHQNKIATVIWHNSSRSSGKQISTVHEYIVAFARNSTAFPEWKAPREGLEDIIKRVRSLWQEGSHEDAYKALNEFIEGKARGSVDEFRYLSNYRNIDEQGRIFYAIDLSGDGPGELRYFKDKGIWLEPPPGRHWMSQEYIDELYKQQRIVWRGERPYRVVYLDEAFENPQGIIRIPTRSGRHEQEHIFGDEVFEKPKPTALLIRLLKISITTNGTILDFFAGSGTTGHAVINLNREDGGQRKFILVEMGEYFNTVLLPRIKKVIFTPEWKDGKPKRMATKEEVERSPRILKILRLESYEDTLNNLELKRTQVQQGVLDLNKDFYEDYMLRYMLDVESRGSASLLNIDYFVDPFSYKLNIATGTVGETKPVVVDLVETFNYLIGLRVKTIDHIAGVRVVTGLNPQGEQVLILWRNLKEMNNDKLDKWFTKQGYNTRDQEYDIIYVNGDNNLENLRKADQTWKVRMIEEEFKRLMFDVKDV
ncbi:adenine-specific DNA-methyltransferase [Thermoflavifilum aggregans]|uniref:site-specific DNA-methyltransferase (adenine-specific) n=1 Tax=Thermoflavifilum aggregans TaxID=454188 RepID=A0A2M9CSW9_9BACT|nr:site-specific DNA-methyltransferase [Thermoflavifilum aggregans]PJJ75004.1 adenine-specific DNA-methyltransferase [Thermoflavifilum aggregans]